VSVVTAGSRRGPEKIEPKTHGRRVARSVRVCVSPCVCVCIVGTGNIEKRPFHKMAAHSLH